MFRFSLVLVTVLCVASASPAEAGWSRLKFWDRSKPATTTKVQKKDRARVEKDVQRLESLLATGKTSSNLTGKSLQSTANEADALAVRILANVKSVNAEKGAVKNAEQLRTHVQNMRKEAMNGNISKTRQHANRALNVATKLDEWAG